MIFNRLHFNIEKMTILPKVNLEKDDETIPEAEPPPAAATPLSPNRFGGTSPGTSSGAGFYPPPRTPPSPSRDREKPFNTGNNNLEFVKIVQSAG